MNLPQNLFDGDVSVQVILCQPDKTRIGEILPSDKHGTFKFNSYSEISFTIDRYYNDLIAGEVKVNPYYDLIESPRIIELRDIGHFVIQDGDEEIGDSESKSVTAFSLEHSTGQKYLENFYVNTGEEGSVETMYHAKTHGAEYAIDIYYEKATSWDKFERYYKKEYTNTNAYNYVEVQVLDENDFEVYKGTNSEDTLYVKAYPNVRFYWPTNPELSLLHLVFERIPEWKIGHVDKELWHEERTFSEDRTAVYDFLYNTAAPTVKFVMVWDTVGNGGENTVSFYKTEEDGITTELTPASTYIDGILYFNKDGNIASPQPTNSEQVLLGNYYVKYDAIETQWATDVFISKDNLASQIKVSYSADDIKTKLKITGADTLDVRDVNLGQNYVLNLDYYNTDLWMGKDLHAKYDNYTTYLAAKTDEYSKLISKWSAAYNEYSDLMNYIPVEPSVLLIGDKFDKLYCTYGLEKATKYVEDKTYYDINGNPAIPTYDEDKTITSEHYINKLTDLLPTLKKKLGVYRVGVDDNGKISVIDKTDDVLLTLINDKSDSVTIRVKCTESASKYENYTYRIYRTLTTASSGLSNTTNYSLSEWINGELTAEKLGLVDSEGHSVFTVKSIGTLGAYLCLAKDETVKDNVEDYGIRLLEEKRDTYTTIFITQTEGYMSQEGSRCVASDDAPEGASIGDRWLDTNSDNATVYEWTENGWVLYSVNNNSSNSAEFENYTRFLDNYNKLQVVQEVLNEKQIIADYLLNGIAMSNIYLTFTNENTNSYYLAGLLRAAIMHHMLSKFDYIVSVSQPPNEYEIDGMMWFQYNERASHITVYKYTDGKWVAQVNNTEGFDFNAILTDYFIDKEKEYAYLTYIFDPTYEKATEFSDNYTYFIETEREVDGITYTTYNKFYAQPNNDSDVLNMYEGIISNDLTIAEGTKCYFTIGDTQYVFVAPQDLNKDSILICNPDTRKLIAGITTLELEEYDGEETMANTTNLSFELKEFYIAKGLEYAVYTNNGTPYVSYSHSQGMCLAQMNYIKELTDMNNYFSEVELMRLSPFIREDEYSDDNFLLTGYESEAEQMDIKQKLLEAGTEELAKICQPKLSFDATMANLLAIPEFAPLRWQFKLGNFVNVEIRKNYVERARLLEVQINFEDASDFSCTFGNLISTKSEIDKHADLLSQAVTVSKQVATHASNWQRGANKATALDDAINDGLKDAALSIASSSGQNISWDNRGILCRKMDETTGEYSNEQMLITNNRLVATSDNWKTSNGVFGKYSVDGQDHWGVLANAVVAGYVEGSTIRGGSLEIGGKDGDKGKFVVHSDGSVEILASDAKTPIYATKSDVDLITYATKYRVELLYEGNTVFNIAGQVLKVKCKVYEGTTEITNDLPNTTIFAWYLNGVLYKNTSVPEIEITNDNFTGSTQLNCQITFDETLL